MFEEMLKTFESYLEFLSKVSDPRTYLGGVSNEEIADYSSKLLSATLDAYRISFEYFFRITQKFMEGDLDAALEAYLSYISELEDLSAKAADNAVYAAYVNTLNRVYMYYLIFLQNSINAFLHSIGMVTRRDIVALAEAYVDLKGDIKKETRKILAKIEELRREMGGGEE